MIDTLNPSRRYSLQALKADVFLKCMDDGFDMDTYECGIAGVITARNIWISGSHSALHFVQP